MAVGVAVDNHYGVAFHSTVLADHGVDDAEVERMRAGQRPTDHRLAAVYALARSMVLNRGKADRGAIACATAAGVTTPEILEIVAGARSRASSARSTTSPVGSSSTRSLFRAPGTELLDP